MINPLKKGEIGYCNLIVLHKKEKTIIKKVVFKAKPDGMYFNKRELLKYNIKEPVKVIKVEVIKSLGFENTAVGFSEVKKSEEIRNKITGAYE